GAFCFFFQAEDGIRVFHVTGVQTCALPICLRVVDTLQEDSRAVALGIDDRVGVVPPLLRNTHRGECLVPGGMTAGRVHLPVAEHLGPERAERFGIGGVDRDLQGSGGHAVLRRYRSRSRATSARWWMSSRWMCRTR